MREVAHSVWLVPEGRALDRLAACVKTLCKRTGTAVFEPHMTLLGDIRGDPERTCRACRRILQKKGSVNAGVTAVAQTDAYFMSLFLDLSLDPDLTQQRLDLAEALSLAQPGGFRPHISLAYGMREGQLEGTELQEFRDAFVGTRMSLTRAVIVASGQDIPIADWRPLSEIDLSP